MAPLASAETSNEVDGDNLAVAVVGPDAAAAEGEHAARNPRLETLLCEDADLRLWLEHTHYFDIAYRERVLDSYRKLKAVEEERQRLLQELRAIGGPATFYSPTTGPVHQAPIHNQLHEVQAKVASRSLTHLRSTSSKEEAIQPSATSTPTLASSSVTHPDGALTSPPPTTLLQPLPPPPPSPPSPPSSPPLSPPTSSPSPTAWAPARRETGGGRPDFPVKTQLESRYFLFKCSNTLNVYMSQRDCRSVILFFSINKSRSFQGYARMVSLPDATIAKKEWIRNINLTSVTAPFRVEWINMTETPFDNLGDLRNSYNEYRSVIVGRDGQEYPPECGRQMVKIFDESSQQGQLADAGRGTSPYVGLGKPRAPFNALRANGARKPFDSTFGRHRAEFPNEEERPYAMRSWRTVEMVPSHPEPKYAIYNRRRDSSSPSIVSESFPPATVDNLIDLVGE
ncbi:hypothetical protein RJ55_03751 [Drechmeria coniospora]|nr:hypothetical protein RJ55_03751 [Drechmeria coniospora]